MTVLSLREITRNSHALLVYPLSENTWAVARALHSRSVMNVADHVTWQEAVRLVRAEVERDNCPALRLDRETAERLIEEAYL